MPIHTIETFNVQFLSILDENGNVDPDIEPEISREDLLKLHRFMTLSRMADTRMLNLQRQGRLGTLPVCTGQEASFCAPVIAIRDTDWFVGSYRELGARLMRGEPLVNLFNAFNGFEEGEAPAKISRTLPLSIILASQLPQAVGLAYGSQMRGEKDTVALVLFGDGATSEGDFHEAFNFAAVLNAPVIFLCQNNQYAISTPRQIQTRSATIAQKAIAYTAAIHAADLGLEVVLVESGSRFGGVCLTEGCIPSKTLINIVNLKESMENAGSMGLKYSGVEVDILQLRQWIDSTVNSLSNGIAKLLYNREVEVVKGYGRFIEDNKIYVEGTNTIIRFKHAIIATGSRINELPAE